MGKKVGDAVKVGDILFTYETDKASFECESTEEGTLLEVFFQEGDEVECLKNVCAIGNPGEDCSVLRPGDAPANEAVKEETSADTASVPIQTAVETTAVAGEKSAVSPRARKLAEHVGVDASLATPTGPNGRIIERDVRELMKILLQLKLLKLNTQMLSAIRRAISKSMYTSLSTMAQLTHTTSFDDTSILAYRKMLKNAKDECAGITLGDIILYAVSRTLLNHPDLNAHMLDDDNICLFKHVNLGNMGVESEENENIKNSLLRCLD